MDGFLLDEWTQLGTQGLLGHQISRRTEEIFEVELNAELALGCCRAIKGDENIDVTIAPSGVADG
jgi:hypothetical protein